MAKDVYTPTAQEMEELCATHIPAKAWCPACVEGKFANAPHRRREKDGDKAVPEVGLDYAFLREIESTDSLTILVMKDRDTKTIFADAIVMKGRGLDGTVNRVVENLARLGNNKVILHSDQEKQYGPFLLESLRHGMTPRAHATRQLVSRNPTGWWSEP